MSRPVLASTSFGLLMALLAGLFSFSSMSDRIENQYGLGTLYALRGPIAPPPGAIVVAIDRNTLAWLRDPASKPDMKRLLACMPVTQVNELDRIRGPGSLPRSVHACLLRDLTDLGFPIVIFDILFAVKGDEEDDRLFADSLRDHGKTAVLIGFERSVVSNGGSEILIEHEVTPLELFLKSATTAGAFIVPRSGGPVYGYWPRVPGFPETKSLSEEAFFLHAGSRPVRRPDGVSTAALEYLWLYGPPGAVETISARDVLHGDKIDYIRLIAKDSIAFVGASDPSATNFPDSFPSFFRGGSDANMSGVELAATAYLNLVHSHNIQRLATPISLIVIALFAAALGFLARARPAWALFAIPLIAASYLAVCSLAFTHARLFLPVATPLFLSAPLAFLVAVLIRYRLARALIMRLAPAPVARRMLTKATHERGVAISDEATISFFDLIGSTSIAEKLPALKFSTMLNTYHDLVDRVVRDHGGFVSAFSGDGVMAVFTRGDTGVDHASRACHSAIAVIREIRLLNVEYSKMDLPPLALRIGVNSGIVAEGEIGAHDRFNFSVVGDVVNLAARLEQLGKTLFPNEKDIILVGPSTADLANASGLSFVNCGLQTIPGREHREIVYRLATA